MAFTVSKVTRVGDSITITGTDGGGNVLTAQGWASAITNFYPSTAYNADGSLIAGSVPRAMTAAEKQSYWAGLLGLQVTATPAQIYP